MSSEKEKQGYLVVVLLLEGGGEVCGHLSDSVTGGVSNPGVLQGVGMRLGLASVLVF